MSAGGGSLTGRQLGDFLLEGLLGAGGMAEVYRGFDVKLKRRVAVKVLPAMLASDANYVQRFRTEAQRVAALNHPHIVPIYHFGEEGPLLYHVMPLLEESLRDRLEREGPLAPQEAVGLIVQIASALSVAHAAGLVHRDVKPENILLNEKNESLLTDFGIARPVMLSRAGRVAQTLSATGLPVGTPEYMAPEQLRGEAIDERADIYALGAVLYELLTGHPPHEAETPYQVAALSLAGKITPPSAFALAVDRELEDVVMIALAPDPAARYADASSFAAAARWAVFPHGASLLSGLPGLRRPTRKIAITGRPLRTRPVRADELPTQPLAQDDLTGVSAVVAAPDGGRAGRQRLSLTRRALFTIIAVAALIVSLGGATFLSVARQMELPIFGFAPTATARPVATVAPSPTPLATATVTPTPSPTPAPTALPTATPVPLPAVQATFVKADATTSGNWSGAYGSQGYILAPNSSAYPFSKVPGYLIVTITSAIPYVWVGATTDPRALQKPPGADGRIAACWYSGTSFTIDVGVTDGETHRLALYLLDWNGAGPPYGRVERVDAVNAITGATLDSRTVGQASTDTNPADQFRNGAYLVWQVRGHVRFTVTNLNASSNAVVSAIFFD